MGLRRGFTGKVRTCVIDRRTSVVHHSLQLCTSFQTRCHSSTFSAITYSFSFPLFATTGNFVSAELLLSMSKGTECVQKRCTVWWAAQSCTNMVGRINEVTLRWSMFEHLLVYHLGM